MEIRREENVNPWTDRLTVEKVMELLGEVSGSRELTGRPPHLLGAAFSGRYLSSLPCHQGCDLLTRDTSGFQRNEQYGWNHRDLSVP